jgi:hypothetical protein
MHPSLSGAQRLPTSYVSGTVQAKVCAAPLCFSAELCVARRSHEVQREDREL